jgi:prepilin-type N-terminal cleavage/methylation domain-containing protein
MSAHPVTGAISAARRVCGARVGQRVASPGHDDGFTLIETAMTCVIMAIILAIAFPTVPLFFGEETSVQNTFGAVDQLVLASETVTRFVHEAVDASPNPPATPFVSASGNAVTFTTNTGKSSGPEEDVVNVSNVAGGTRKFGMSLIPAANNTCPPGGSGCTYLGNATDVVLINFLTNGTGGSPVFSYLLQGGEVCGGAPPGAPTTTTTSTLTNGSTYSTLNVSALTKAVAVNDTIFIGAGPTAQSVTASSAAAVGATSISVTSFTASSTFNSGTSVYDSALTPVPGTLPTALSLVASSGTTTLHVNALPSAVAQNDVVVVGTGASAQTVTATAAAVAGATTISVSALASTAASGSSVYDSSCSATQLTQITAVSINLQATKNPGGQPTGYQSLAYLLSPTYNAGVG